MSDPTRSHERFDPDRTVPHQPVHQAPPPAAVVIEQVPPPPPTRKKRSRWGCLLRGALASLTLSLISVGLLLTLYVVLPPARMNILILGLDARPNEPNVTRSDVMMVVTVDPKQPYVGMLSIPRDLYVDVPGYGYNRINTAHVFGEINGAGRGPQLAAQTVANTFGIPIDRTVRLNFDAFVQIVDAAGGLTIDVPSAFVDYEYPTTDYGTMIVEFQAGEQVMDGERALQYARIRHGGSDFIRADRQQQVVEALIKQLINPLNWWRLPDVYTVFQQNVETDITLWDTLLLGPAVLLNGATNIDRVVLDQTYVNGTLTDAGASVQQPDWSAINPLIDRMFRK